MRFENVDVSGPHNVKLKVNNVFFIYIFSVLKRINESLLVLLICFEVRLLWIGRRVMLELTYLLLQG